MQGELTVLLCDDDAVFLQHFAALLRQEARLLARPLKILSCQTPEEVAAVREDVQIAFLDIEMPGSGDGFSVGEAITQRHENALIIFVTSHDAYWKQAFKIHPFEYINKASLHDELHDVLCAAVDALAQRGYLYIRDENRLVSKSRVLYIESDRHYVWLHFLAGPPAMEKGSIKEWAAKLGPGFFVCHQRYIVNLRHIAQTGDATLTLTDGTSLPLSRRQKNAYRKAIRDYINTQGRFV